MPPDTPLDNLQEGIAAALSGDRKAAVNYLTQAVRQDPESAEGWLWLSRVLDDPQQQNYCQERAAQLNPRHQDEPFIIATQPFTTDAPAQPSVSTPAPASGQSAASPSGAPDGDPFELREQIGSANMPALERRKTPRLVLILGAGLVLVILLAAALVFAGLLKRAPAQSAAPLLPARSTPNQQEAASGPTPSPQATLPPLPTTTSTASATPLPTSTPTPFASPTPTLDPTRGLPPEYSSAQLANCKTGSGPLTLRPGEEIVYLFKPLPQVRVSQVQSALLILTSPQTGSSELKVDLWDRAAQTWVRFEPAWGETVIDSPAAYVYPMGDVYVFVHNLGAQSIALDNLGLRIVVTRTDGKTITYGLAP